MSRKKKTKEQVIKERFLTYIDEIIETRKGKGKDYGSEEDSLSNLRECSRIGIKPMIGVFIRMEDKMGRIRSFINKGELENESVRDSLLDLSVYAILAKILMDEEDDFS